VERIFASISYHYNSYTDASNYERLAIYAASGSYYVQSQHAGSGLYRDVYLSGQNVGVLTNEVLRWTFDYQGHLLPASALTSNVGSPAARVNNFYGANIDLSGNVTAQGTGAYSGDVSARLLQATGFTTVAAGLASSGVSLWGIGVAHANIAWLPNERTFHLGTGNNATDVIDNYGWTHLRLSGNISMGALPSAWSVAYRAVEFGARGTAVWGAVDSSQLLTSRNGYYTDATGWQKPVALSSQYMSISGSGWSFLHSASTSAGPISDWVNVAVIDKLGSAIYSTLFLQDTLTVGGNIVVNGTGANYLTGGSTYTANLFPNGQNAYGLGAPNAQWSTVTAGAFYGYNSYTDPSNWERFVGVWAGNEYNLLTQKAGTGSSRNLNIGTDGSGIIQFLTAGSTHASLNGSTFSVLGGSQPQIRIIASATQSNLRFDSTFTAGSGGLNKNWAIVHSHTAYGDLVFRIGNAEGSDPISAGTTVVSLTSTGLKVLGQLVVNNPTASAWGTFATASAV
jgi:hypothetical protein